MIVIEALAVLEALVRNKMCNIIYYIQERDTGKTRDLVEIFLEYPEETLFVVFSHSAKKCIQNLIPWQYHKRIKVAASTSFIGYCPSLILIDEYDLWDKKEKANIWSAMLPCLRSGGNIIIKTTPLKKFNKQNFFIAKFFSEKRVKELKKKEQISIEEYNEILEIQTNLFMHKNVKLINEHLLYE